jgi:hypothetical protein
VDADVLTLTPTVTVAVLVTGAANRTGASKQNRIKSGTSQVWQ